MRDKIAEIKLSNGMIAICDVNDYHEIKHFKWYAHRRGNTYYASATRTIHGVRKMIHMHRMIMSPIPEGKEIDHIDGNGLNNTRENLRFVTHQQNCMNTRIHKQKSSKYKGVYWCKGKKKYLVKIWVNKKGIHLGYFHDEKEAAKKYNQVVYELFGNLAYLNEIGD